MTTQEHVRRERVSKSLRQVYDEVLKEPIPAELLKRLAEMN